MPGIKITDLPSDNSNVVSGDIFLKVKNNTTYKMDGSTLVRQFSGITGATNLGAGIQVFNSLTPDRTTATFNTLSAGEGINIVRNNNTISISLSGDGIITHDMIDPGAITADLLDPDLINGTRIKPFAIGYSQLQSGDSTESLQDRVSDAWVNFNGARVTSGAGYTPIPIPSTFSQNGGTTGTTTVIITCNNHGLVTGNTVNISGIAWTTGANVVIPGPRRRVLFRWEPTYVNWDNSGVFTNGNYVITRIDNNRFSIRTTRLIYQGIGGTCTITKPNGSQNNGLVGDQISITAGSNTGFWKTNVALTWASTDVGVIFYITAPGIYNAEPVRVISVNTATNTAQIQFLNGAATTSRIISGNAYTWNSFGIRSCYNVDGITKEGVGRWKVSFRHNRTDNWYAATGTCNDPTTTPDAAILSVNAQTTNDVTISTTRVSPPARNAITSGFVDSTNVSLVVFGI